MDIEFDPSKNQRNITERGLSFEEVAGFEFERALFWVDDRKDMVSSASGPWAISVNGSTPWCLLRR